MVTVFGVLAGGLGVGAGPVDAGGNSFMVVTKVVQGPVPAGTEFVVKVDCTDDYLESLKPGRVPLADE